MQVETLGSPYFNVNAGHIREFNEDLYRQLICYPQEVIPAFDMSVNELFFEKYPDAVLSHQVQVMPFNADKTKNMRSLNPEGKWLSAIGMPMVDLWQKKVHLLEIG